MTTKKKRIMREFEISEISAVDRPAQAHARMSVMKREEPVGFDSFEAAVDHLAKFHECSRTDAMSMAARAHPALIEKYNAEGREQIVKAAHAAQKARTKPEAVTAFHKCVEDVARRDNCSRTEALRRARTEHPEEFSSYEEA